jgi:hypothetical protein
MSAVVRPPLTPTPPGSLLICPAEKRGSFTTMAGPAEGLARKAVPGAHSSHVIDGAAGVLHDSAGVSHAAGVSHGAGGVSQSARGVRGGRA